MPATAFVGDGPLSRHISDRAKKRSKTLAQKPVASSDPLRKEHQVTYKTTATDVAFIGMCRKAYGRIAGRRPTGFLASTRKRQGAVDRRSLFCAGWQSSKDWKDGDTTYAGMVEVSRALMKVDTYSKNTRNCQALAAASAACTAKWLSGYESMIVIRQGDTIHRPA